METSRPFLISIYQNCWLWSPLVSTAAKKHHIAIHFQKPDHPYPERPRESYQEEKEKYERLVKITLCWIYDRRTEIVRILLPDGTGLWLWWQIMMCEPWHVKKIEREVTNPI